MIEDEIVDKGNVSIVERYKVIDVIKGYGICLMVCGHSGVPFTNWIYLFHMALFFIASGIYGMNVMPRQRRTLCSM